MMLGEAPAAIHEAVREVVQDVNHKTLGKATQVSNALRNSAIEVLTNESPSSPGSPPGMRSGNLRRNWSLGVRGAGGSGSGISVVAYIESTMKYASYLEDGTRKMAARPFVDPILEDVEPEVDRIFADF